MTSLQVAPRLILDSNQGAYVQSPRGFRPLRIFTGPLSTYFDQAPDGPTGA